MMSKFQETVPGRKVDHPTGWSKHYTVDSGSVHVFFFTSLAVSDKLFTTLFWQFIKTSIYDDALAN